MLDLFASEKPNFLFGGTDWSSFRMFSIIVVSTVSMMFGWKSHPPNSTLTSMWKTFTVYQILCKINGLFMFSPILWSKHIKAPPSFSHNYHPPPPHHHQQHYHTLSSHTLVSVPNWWGGRLLRHQVSFCKSWKTIHWHHVPNVLINQHWYMNLKVDSCGTPSCDHCAQEHP